MEIKSNRANVTVMVLCAAFFALIIIALIGSPEFRQRAQEVSYMLIR